MLPKSVRIMEVGPRDGLQNEKIFVDTACKISFIESLAEAGLKYIEITSFVSPKWIPTLADQVEVARGIARRRDVSYAALVPNMKGYERALVNGISEVSFVLAASETHNLKNINAKTADALAHYSEVAGRARLDKIPFRAYISCAFGCPYEGRVAVSQVVKLSRNFIDLGAYEVSLGDTIGIGNPKQTEELVAALSSELPISQIGLHMHDTRGTALANIFAALRMGVSSFDSSSGGLGGCPYAKGASGNVATEDLLYMLHGMGIETGISINKICEISYKMERLLKRVLPAKMLALYKNQIIEG